MAIASAIEDARKALSGAKLLDIVPDLVGEKS